MSKSVLLGLALVATLCGGLAAVRATMTPSSDRVEVRGILQQDTAFAITKFGGTVREVYVKEGDAVVKGQLLARLDQSEVAAHEAQLRGALSSVPAQQKSLHIVTDLSPAGRRWLAEQNPKVSAAEREYAAAVAAYEELEKARAPEGELSTASARLHRAEDNRLIAKAEAGAAIQDLQNGEARISNLAEQGNYAMKHMKEVVADSEVRAPEAGIVDLLRVHRGDSIPALSALAAVSVTGVYYTTVHLPFKLLDPLQTGTQISARIGVVTVEARVTRIATVEDARVAGSRRAPGTYEARIALLRVPAAAAPGGPVSLSFPAAP